METHSSPKTAFWSLTCLLSSRGSANSRGRAATHALRALTGLPLGLILFQGTNCLAAATATPTSSTWGAVAVGNISAAHDITLKNGNSTAITLKSPSFSGANPGDYKISKTTCGSSLGAGASCVASISFVPTVSGTRTATLNFNDSDSTSPQQVMLTGTGTGGSGTVSMSPTSLSFGSVNVGSTSAAKTATVTNGSATTITIKSVAITGTNPGDFTTSSCPGSLAPSASCTISVTFKPATTGARSATLTVSDTASNSPQTSALSGTGGSTSGGSVTLSQTSMSFQASVGSTSAAQTTTLSNGTKSSITINSITLGGANPGDFTKSQTCGSTLAASASCTVSVAFKPTASGGRSAVLSFSDTASNSPQTVSLSGSNPGAFQIIPMNPTVYENNSVDFAATVDVTWLPPSCGSIGSTSGTYTAPGSTGKCTVTAMQTGGSNAKVSTTVTVLAGSGSGTLALYPTSAAVYVGNTQVFQAQLSGIPDSHSLTYSTTGGTITNQGVYTPPSSAGSYSVTVKDLSLNTTATASVTVFSKVTVDFASRSTSLHAVPAHLFGAERMDSMHNTADLDLVKAGGINYARFYALIPSVFASKTPNWGPLDSNVAKISAGGTKIILQVHQTPPWLLPSSNPCPSTPNNAMPTDVNAWGQMAAQYVNHLEDKYPGVVTDYEIWNEPNTQALCVPTANKLSSYLKLYDAAAPLMIAAIKAHGSSARVGGPATAGFQSSWVNALLSDPIASQNIGFMAYHDYMFGKPQVEAQWDTYNGTITTSGCPAPCGISVYQRTQNTGAGPMATYVYAASRVAAGKQPQGKNLPIYNTEYNLNWDWMKNCCQNNPIYAPVWNGMYIADVLNAVYNGAPNVIGHMVYFAANASGTKSNTNSNFCLIGNWDTNMDCPYPNPSSPQPYPQYFLYQLLGSTNYLGLQNGGYMASTISPGTKGNGLVVTAFYTTNVDAIVLINPTADPLDNLTVTANNTGIASASGTLYQIVNGQSIQRSSVSLQPQGGTSYSMTVDIPAYSVQAIAISH